MSNSAPIIKATDLRRYYKIQRDSLRTGRFGLGLLRRDMDYVKAIDGISFEIEEASAVGLIGLNGAGKSTLLKLITGVLVPASGELIVGGLKPSEKRKVVARNIGVVFGHRSQLWPDVPVIESFKVLRRIYSVDEESFQVRLEQLSDLLEMHELIRRPTRQLSLRQRVRAEIMASLLHGPKLLILDEPTVGLDIVAKAKIRRLIRSLVEEENVTVILASHEVTDIEEICDRAILLHEGHVLFDGTLDELRARVPVERSLVLDIVPDDEANKTGSETLIDRVTVPLDQVGGAKRLSELAESGTIVDASVTGGSLETIIATMFERE